MNKDIFTKILQVALFKFDGATEKEIAEYNLFNPEIIQIGVKMCEFLQSKQINTSKKEVTLKNGI